MAARLPVSNATGGVRNTSTVAAGQKPCHYLTVRDGVVQVCSYEDVPDEILEPVGRTPDVADTFGRVRFLQRDKSQILWLFDWHSTTGAHFINDGFCGVNGTKSQHTNEVDNSVHREANQNVIRLRDVLHNQPGHEQR